MIEFARSASSSCRPTASVAGFCRFRYARDRIRNEYYSTSPQAESTIVSVYTLNATQHYGCFPMGELDRVSIQLDANPSRLPQARFPLLMPRGGTLGCFLRNLFYSRRQEPQPCFNVTYSSHSLQTKIHVLQAPIKRQEKPAARARGH